MKMLVIGIRNVLLRAGWRCFHYENSQVLTKRKIKPKTSGIIDLLETMKGNDCFKVTWNKSKHLIVTGDEVLKGQVLDTNSNFLCKKLYEMGIKVVAVSKVADDVSVISAEVEKFSREYDYVLTTGGVGPTHDDVTYEAVAKAFNDKLFYHPELSKLVLKFYKTNDIHHPALKMAYIPTTSKLTYGFDPVTQRDTLYPNISVQNVFMFPGVPHLCERLFNLAGDKLFSGAGKFFTRELYLSVSEGNIVRELNETVKKFPDVLFGSYPKFFHSYYDVKISMESVDESEVDEALDYLKQLIPKEFHVEYDQNPFSDKWNKLSFFKDDFLVRTKNKLESLVRTKNPSDIFLYFDGGKNSTVLLYILSALYEKSFPNVPLNGIYVQINSKINSFVTKCTNDYNLNLLRLSEENFRNFANSSSKICVIKGTRESDPNARNIFKSFEGLPIVNPLTDWNYNDVWKIIRGLNLPYCALYDQGYTSICHVDARPNKHLITTGPRTDLIYYKKAFELMDGALEDAS